MPNLILLAPANVNHTHKWAHSLNSRGYSVTIITQHLPSELYDDAIKIVELRHKGTKGYFLNAPQVKTLLQNTDTDIIHAHFASGYGTLAALSVKQPYLLSVWGSDVYEFPYRSWFHRHWIKWSLSKASKIASTSHAMAQQVKILIGETDINVTPFGVSIEDFQCHRPAFSNGTITVGTAKKLEHRYGIDVLINGFAMLLSTCSPELRERLKLRIVGDGSYRAELERLTRTLAIDSKVTFVGAVPSYSVVEELNKIDIVVLSSRIESFGVSAIEALAAKRPTIAANVGGLPEIIQHRYTGLLCEKENIDDFAKALRTYIDDTEFALNLAEQGKTNVSKVFSEHATTDTMCKVLEQFERQFLTRTYRE